MQEVIKKPRQKHTDESLRLEALKYPTKQAFREGNMGAYNAAWKKGKEFFESICGHMLAMRQSHTQESLRLEALKYTSRKDFKKGNEGAYAAAYIISRAFLDSICAHMEVLRHVYTDDELRIEALKYSTRVSFSEGNHSTYQAALRRGLEFLDSICAHMDTLRHEHTDESLTLEALKYPTKPTFEEGNKGAYEAARRKGKAFFESVCAHMGTLRNYYTEDYLRDEASKHTSSSAFEKDNRGAYRAALGRGKEFFESICGHMVGMLQHHTDESLRFEALKYPTRDAFAEGNYGAYSAARKRGKAFFESVCEHMEDSVSGSSRISRTWLEELSVKEGKLIQHKLNGGEYRIPGTRLSVDGYCKETNTIYEFHGDCWHGNPELYAPTDKIHPFSKHKTAKQLYEATIAREEKIKSLGYNLVVIWESEYRNSLAKTPKMC